MKNLDRREFLSKSTAGFGAALIASRMPFNLDSEPFAKTV
jgi:hypothetical protein